jgi:hypothetical protein
MGQSAVSASRNQARGGANPRAASRIDFIPGDVDMHADEAGQGRRRSKHAETRPDLRTGIVHGDLRDAIRSPPRSLPSNEFRQNLQSPIENDMREDLRSSNNRSGMGDVDVETQNVEAVGRSSGSNRKSLETCDTNPSKGAKTPMSTISSKAVAVNSVVQVSPATAVAAEGRNMPPPLPPPKTKSLFVPSSKGVSSRPAERDGIGNMPPPAAKANLFSKKPAVSIALASERNTYQDGSLTPRQPSSPILPAQSMVSRAVVSPVHVSKTLNVSKDVPGFLFGEEFLKHRSKILDSPQFKQRFRKEGDGCLVELHDDMCHRNEWEHREQQGNRSKFQPTFETAYSNQELRRETELTLLCRSIKGITRTLDHIQQNFKGDDNAAREQFDVSFYPTLRAAENDLKNSGNKPYSREWIVAVERMIKFCMHMYYLNTEQNNSDMHSKSLEYAHKFILLLMEAYQEMWVQHVMPPNCVEFCALSLASSALARISNNNNKGGGLAALCGVYFMLPLHIRQKPQVKQTLNVLLCYFSDNVTRFFKLLDNNCPYLVVLMCSSEFYQIRCRFMKNFIPAKLEKVPFETLARFHRAHFVRSLRPHFHLL